MAVTYTWNCRTLDCYTKFDASGTELTDVVFNVHWSVQGTKTVSNIEYTSSSIGTVSVSTESIDPSTFIAVNELTNAEVTAWCKAALGADEVTRIEANIASDIEEKVAPKVVTLTIES
jgi:hypothetical protein|tara:strand:+ start:1506 stop:1859 length:354 start_codon:yes stop_codon:yes gene_type:complete